MFAKLSYLTLSGTEGPLLPSSMTYVKMLFQIGGRLQTMLTRRGE